jgi:hypothetical protein
LDIYLIRAVSTAVNRVLKMSNINVTAQTGKNVVYFENAERQNASTLGKIKKTLE